MMDKIEKTELEEELQRKIETLKEQIKRLEGANSILKEDNSKYRQRIILLESMIRGVVD